MSQVSPIRTGLDPAPKTAAEKKAWKAAQDFEALFLRQIFSSMKSATKALGEDDEAGSGPAKDIYQDMYFDKISDQASQGRGIGIARHLYPQLLRQGEGAIDGLLRHQSQPRQPNTAGMGLSGVDSQALMGAAPRRTTDSTATSGARSLDEVRLRALVDRASAATGVDSSLIRGVIQVESAGRHNATSVEGAVGLMQLMPATARDLGVTRRDDPEQSVMGGAKYLAQLLRKYGGDETRALAGYNAGPGAVDKYGGVPPYAETRNYVQKVLEARRSYQ